MTVGQELNPFLGKVGSLTYPLLQGKLLGFCNPNSKVVTGLPGLRPWGGAFGGRRSSCVLGRQEEKGKVMVVVPFRGGLN